MPSTIPKKYEALGNAFPDLIEICFDAKGKLNAVGQRLQELLEKRKLLNEGIFIFRPEEGVMHLGVGIIQLPEKENTKFGEIRKFAADFLKKIEAKKRKEITILYANKKLKKIP